jgi:hypothetical protein
LNFWHCWAVDCFTTIFPSNFLCALFILNCNKPSYCGKNTSPTNITQANGNLFFFSFIYRSKNAFARE